MGKKILLTIWLGIFTGFFAVNAQGIFAPDTLDFFTPILENLEPIREVPLVYQPDSLIRDSLRYEYTKIKNFAYKSSFTKELYKLIFVDPKPNRIPIMRIENSEERFEEHAGKTIGTIDVKVLPPYGRSVYDTSYVDANLAWLKKVANRVHMRTSRNTVRKQLTFKAGDRLIPFDVVQNELLLRSLTFIDDVVILTIADSTDVSKVNLLIVCKDDFSWREEVSTNFLSSVKLSFANKNFLRVGHYVTYQISFRENKDKQWGNYVEYRMNSIFGKHFDFKGFYQNDYVAKQLWLELKRPFISSTIKWGGGLEFGRVFRREELPNINLVKQTQPFDYHTLDIWGGRSFSLGSKYSYNQNIYVLGRFLNTMFVNRPEISRDSNQYFYNRQNHYIGIVYRKLKYYRANLVYDFGRTEDIPTGLYTGLTMGYEVSNYINSGFAGVEAKYSHFNQRTQRFYTISAAIASFFNKNGFERGLFKLDLHHISNLISINRSRFRFYNNLNYARGIERYPGNYLYFRDEDIMDFNSDTIRGSQKLSTTLITTFFLPYIKLGFRGAISTYTCFGVIAPENKSLIKSRTYTGIGFAINLRNDNLAFRNICLRFTFYPRPPSDMRVFNSSISSRFLSGFHDYNINKPGDVRYE